MKTYSFCETQFAGPRAPWHLRVLSKEGRKCGGGADTSALWPYSCVGFNRCGNFAAVGEQRVYGLFGNLQERGEIVKGKNVVIGLTYAVKVSGKITPVRITGVSVHGGWDGLNETTRLRFELVRINGKWIRNSPTPIGEVEELSMCGPYDPSQTD